MRVRTLVLVSAAALALSGCAAPIIGSLTLSQLSTIAGIISTATTGKGLSDHALSLLTGEDCSITEGLLRSDRDICEPRGSLATQEDFKGVFAYLDRRFQQGDPGDKALQRYAAARGDELAKSEISDETAPEQVIEANATGLNLRRLSFLDGLDFLSDEEPGGASAPVATAAADPMNDPHVSLLTYRDTDRDGTPRIVERHVYMMAPIPDSPATATAMATPVAPAPVTTPVVSAAPAPQPAPVVQAQPAPQLAPAPQVVAAVSPAPSVKAIPAVYAKPAKKSEAAQAPQQLVHWYLSGR